MDAKQVAKERLDQIESALATLHTLMSYTDPDECGWPDAAQLAYVAEKLDEIEDFWTGVAQ